jgi:transmembrane sensor
VSAITARAEQDVVPDSIRGEAAVWLAKLHLDARSEQTEMAFRHWLAESPLHRAAFERMTEIWNYAAGLSREPSRERGESTEFRRALRRTTLTATAALVVYALVVTGVMYLLPQATEQPPETFVTRVGERRFVTLSDGSRMVLNTSSRVRVMFTGNMRRVILEKGQARFEIIHDAAKPFVVRAGERQILALGTAFDVRWTDQRLSIVLTEGHVAVLPAGVSPTVADSSAVLLQAGERLDFKSPTLAVKSTARLEQEEGWVTGRVVFDATRLSAALAEINRYAPRPLKLAKPAMGDLLVSGTFSVDDSSAFAHAVAQMFSLRLIETEDGVVLESR